MLCGRAAFAGASIPEVVFKVVYEPAPPLAQLVPNIPPVVLAAIERAMQKKPDDRFANIGDLVTALTGVELATLPGRAGTPIAIGSGAAGSRPGGSRKVSSADAMAKTMGSGDHAEALMATAYEPNATGTQPQAQPAHAAQTPAPALGMSAGALGLAAGGYPAPHPAAHAPPAYPAAPTMATAGSGAGRWKWIAIAMAALLAAVVAFVVVKQRSRPETAPVASNGDGHGSAGSNGAPGSGGAAPDKPSLPATGPVDAGAPILVDAAVAQPADASPVTVRQDAGSGGKPDKPTTPSKPDKPTTPSKPDKPTPPPPGDPDDGGDLGDAAETVLKAWKAAESGNDLAAKKLANSVLDTAGTPDKARNQAHQIIALVACRADDRETAVRAARAARALRPKVVKICKEHDIELPRRGR